MFILKSLSVVRFSCVALTADTAAHHAMQNCGLAFHHFTAAMRAAQQAKHRQGSGAERDMRKERQKGADEPVVLMTRRRSSE